MGGMSGASTEYHAASAQKEALSRDIIAARMELTDLRKHRDKERAEMEAAAEAAARRVEREGRRAAEAARAADGEAARVAAALGDLAIREQSLHALAVELRGREHRAMAVAAAERALQDREAGPHTRASHQSTFSARL